MKELTMELEAKSRTPLYEQIYSYMKCSIRTGKIPAGEKLPSTRALAAHLEVSRSTVDLAYSQLLSEGYIESEPYRGYFVCAIDALCQSAALLPEEKKDGGPKEEPPSFAYDFSPNGIDPEHFPFRSWRKITRHTLTDDRRELFWPGEARGDFGLREAICGYLYESRGVSCRPGQVILGAGNDYLLMLLSQILEKPARIAMESPTYKQAYRVFEGLGFWMTTVAMDSSGMDVEGLCASGASVAYVMPSHQYPLGIVMPMRRRMELLAWAQGAEGRYIIEDDYDSEFRYVGKPIPALQGHGGSGKVIYLGTFSKSIAPAIRMSYMVLPERLLEIYEARAAFLSCTVSRIDQRILEEFIRSGGYERHLNRMRTLYKGKRDVLLEELRCLEPVCRISGEEAGVHLLLTFTNGMSEEEVIRRAAAADVRVYGLSEYDIRPAAQAADGKDRSSGEENRPATVLVGYAGLKEEEIRLGARALAGALG